MRIIVVIPAHNEAATIADIAARARRDVERAIVVDDGSGDGTGEALRHSSPITVLRNEFNRGKAGSLWRGMQLALREGADAVITLDGDGQHCPEEIPRLIHVAAAHPDHIVIGARRRRFARVPLIRRCANRFADFWISWAAGYRISDSQSGFRLYPAALLRQLHLPHDRAHGFVWESEVLIEAARLGFASVPVTVDAIYDESARASHYRAIRDTLRITRMVARRLIRRGMYPAGLLRVLQPLPGRIDHGSVYSPRIRSSRLSR